MMEELENLSLAIGAVKEHDAKQVADAVNRRLVDLLKAKTIRIYWRKPAQEGIILNTIAFVNHTTYEDPEPFQILDTPNGALSWVYHNKEILWIENLKSSDLSQPMKNKTTNTTIESEYLTFSYDPDSMMILPFLIKGEVRGIYAIDIDNSGRLSLNTLNLLQRLTKSIGLILSNADQSSSDLNKTSRAISQFLDSIREFKFDPVLIDEKYKAGFIARPFKAEFSEVEKSLVKLLEDRNIQAKHYEPEGGTNFMIDEIMKQITHSHFCVADITDSNPNVMAEVGMMMILKKHFLLLRKRGNDAPRPFDVAQYPLYEYKISESGDQVLIWNEADKTFQPFNEILDNFIEHLPAESGFTAANPWNT